MTHSRAKVELMKHRFVDMESTCAIESSFFQCFQMPQYVTFQLELCSCAANNPCCSGVVFSSLFRVSYRFSLFSPVPGMKKIQLIPLVLNFGDDNFYGPWDKKFYDPGYGVGAHPQDFHKAVPRYYHPEKPEFFDHRKTRREIETRDVTTKKRDHKGKEGFQVSVDVHQFAPNEITVKTVDQAIVIDAQHEEKEDDLGYISRHFRRRYQLPEEYQAKDVIAMLSSDGVLTVKAPPIGSGVPGREKEVYIHHTGPARLNISMPTDPVIAKDGGTNSQKTLEDDFEVLDDHAVV